MTWQWWEAVIVGASPLAGLAMWAAWEHARDWWRSPARRRRAADDRFARRRRA